MKMARAKRASDEIYNERRRLKRALARMQRSQLPRRIIIVVFPQRMFKMLIGIFDWD